MRMASTGDLTLAAVRDSCGSKTDIDFAKWAISVGMLASEGPECCGRQMHIGERKDKKDHCCYRCTECKKRVSIRHGSWCSGSHCTLKQLAMLLAYWISDRSVETATEDCDVCTSTVLEHYSHFREVAEALYLDDLNQTPLGGRDTVCEIDESVFGRAKYNRGKGLALPLYWIFGAVDCVSRRVVMEHADKRDSETLLPMIISWVEQGTTIHSDCWKAYNGLAGMGYTHETVNHSENFVDPSTGAHTQMIESTWGACKRFLRARHARTRSTIMEHVHEWCYRRNLGGSFGEMWKSLNLRLNSVN